jgi:hypothetical protein
MLTNGKAIFKCSKPPIPYLAVGAFLLCSHLGLVRSAAGQTSPAKTHDVATAAQLSSFYRNDFETPVKGEPFSAVEERVTAFRTADSKLENRSLTTTRIARDTQGRLRVDRESVTYGEHDVASRSVSSYIADPMTHSLLILDPERHSAVELPWNAPQLSKADSQGLVPKADDTGEIRLKVESLGVRSLQGLTVDGSLRELTIPIKSVLYYRAVAVSIETWTSRDLNIPVWSRSETPTGEISTTTLKNIVRAAPDRQLFELPADYSLSSAGSDAAFAMVR